MKNQLSALIDGEFDIASAEHLIASAKTGGELKQCWTHYHLIGDAMRNEGYLSHGFLSHDFSNRVMALLETEPTVLAPNNLQGQNTQINVQTSPASNNLFSYVNLTKASPSKLWSIAASVAAVMFVGVMVLQFNQSEELAPVEIAQSVPTEYLQAHQAAASNGAAYYIQNASFSEKQSK